MAIRPNGSPDELQSPFYISNLERCKAWKSFVASLGAQCKKLLEKLKLS